MTPSFDAIGIVVGDMAASLAFYRRLGCDVPSEADDEGHVEWKSPGGVRLMWDATSVIHSFDPDWKPPTGGPAMGLAFACGTSSAVDSAIEELRSAGHEVASEPWDAFWGQRYAQVLDPDGNHVDLFAPL